MNRRVLLTLVWVLAASQIDVLRARVDIGPSHCDSASAVGCNPHAGHLWSRCVARAGAATTRSEEFAIVANAVRMGTVTCNLR